MNEQQLNGRRAIVTGGASGIGKAVATRLAERGAEVVVTDIDDANGEAVATQIGGTYVHLDVASSDEWDAVVISHGPFDIAFLNAGISTGEEREPDELPIVNLTDAAYRQIMAINVDGVVFGARAVLPAMIERGSGDIIATASMAGLVPMGPDPIYGLTKHAVVGFIRSLAAASEQHSADICFSAMCPGFVDTNIIGAELKEQLVEMQMGILDPLVVGDTVLRSLSERHNGAQWVMWHGVETATYDWNPAVDFTAVAAPNLSAL
jgi:NAD(P)-dependent dehydrogenase (short-subunit alcohol dehydrogenase family)